MVIYFSLHSLSSIYGNPLKYDAAFLVVMVTHCTSFFGHGNSMPQSHNPEVVGSSPGCVRKGIGHKAIKSFMQVTSLWRTPQKRKAEKIYSAQLFNYMYLNLCGTAFIRFIVICFRKNCFSCIYANSI